MPCSRMMGKITAGSIRRKQQWVPAAAVTAHVKVQPSQWNMGKVHRYLEAGVRPTVIILPTAFR